ncbi:hypothetical protein [Nonomuraea dietziae]|uniref:hypothetical protein n=1 Tax=Nonomuraea dietziae TaxID=65515 RepID=UPI0031D08F7D
MAAGHGGRLQLPVPPVRKLREAGVTVACGHDGIRDLVGAAYGSGDMLERAMHLAYRSTSPRRRRHRARAGGGPPMGGARALNLPGYGLSSATRPTSWSSPWAAPPRRWSPIPPRSLVMKRGVHAAA